MTLIDETLVQFGGKISAHNLQKFGAEFRPALGELPHVLQIPHGKPCVPARHYVHWTDEATIRAHIPDELSGTVRQASRTAANCFDFAGNEDYRVGYLLTLFDDYLAGREVDPARKAGHL